MTRLAFAAALALLALPVRAQTDASLVPDDAPEWRSMSDAVEAARAADRLLVVHAYTAWCGWCARMDRDTYTDDTVQAYLAAHFEATRLDLESREVVPFFEYTASMAELGDALQVTGTPTTVFVDSDGTLITKLPGYNDPETFLYALRYVHERAYEGVSFAEFVQAQQPTESGG